MNDSTPTPAASTSPSAAPALRTGAPSANTPALHSPEGQQKNFAELVSRIAGLGAQAFHRVRAGRGGQANLAYPELIARFNGSPVGESVQRVATQAWHYVPPRAKPWVMIGVGALNVALMVYEGYDQHRRPKAAPGSSGAGAGPAPAPAAPEAPDATKPG